MPSRKAGTNTTDGIGVMDERIRLGISTCLLGEQVRYDGGHKHDRFLTDVLGPYVEWVSVCPELEVGMGVPREAVRLVGPASAPKMVGIDSGTDWTDRMLAWSRRRVNQFGKMKLSGYVLKSKSPSCGMERVKVYNAKGMAAKDGMGLFADVFIKGHPLIPVEEEGRLNDPHLRDNFIVRVFAYHRLQKLMGGKFTVGKLVQFHTAEKYLLLAHSPKYYRELGPLVANAKKMPVAKLKEKYTTTGGFLKCSVSRARRPGSVGSRSSASGTTTGRPSTTSMPKKSHGTTGEKSNAS